jgi:hypothetical protein
MQRPLTGRMKRRLHESRLAFNDWFIGLHDAGAMDRSYLLGIAAHLPSGVTEIGMHPARSGPSPGRFEPLPSWRREDELAALTDPDVIAAFRGRADLIRFQDLTRGTG